MKKYIVNEQELKALVLAFHELSALNAGGVDDWEWHSDSLKEYGFFELEESENLLAGYEEV